MRAEDQGEPAGGTLGGQAADLGAAARAGVAFAAGAVVACAEGDDYPRGLRGWGGGGGGGGGALGEGARGEAHHEEGGLVVFF